jgi:uncharacterized protein YegJ (DUF2314 family)
MKICLTFLFIGIYTTGYCQKKVSGSENYSSVNLAKGDATFLALKDTAQTHLQNFIDSLNIHGRDTANYRFGVKSDFVEKDVHEHMWSLILSYADGNFKGVFIDSAFNIKNIKTWDRVIVHKKDIEDWSIYNRITGKTIGNYSEMYLKEQGN